MFLISTKAIFFDTKKSRNVNISNPQKKKTFIAWTFFSKWKRRRIHPDRCEAQSGYFSVL